MSPHIRIFEVLLLTPAVHFSSERCRRSMLSFANSNCVNVYLSELGLCFLLTDVAENVGIGQLEIKF